MNTLFEAQKTWMLLASYDAGAMASFPNGAHKWVQPAYSRFKAVRHLVTTR